MGASCRLVPSVLKPLKRQGAFPHSSEWSGVRKWVIHDRADASCLPVDVRFDLKAPRSLGAREMTRRTNSELMYRSKASHHLIISSAPPSDVRHHATSGNWNGTSSAGCTVGLGASTDVALYFPSSRPLQDCIKVFGWRSACWIFDPSLDDIGPRGKRQ
jgi:hypothetical protein